MKKTILTLMVAPLLLQACASTAPQTSDGNTAPPAFGENQSLITIVSPASLLITSFNRNNDYVIDRTEFITGRDLAFKNADSDNNGRINPFEMDIWRFNALGSKDASPTSMFFDADFNQTVTKTEFNKAFDTLFNNSDKNENGNIMFAELVRVAAKPMGKQQGKKSKKGGQSKRGQGQGKGGGRGQHDY